MQIHSSAGSLASDSLQRALGSSRDSVAQDVGAQITLTRFAALPGDAGQDVGASDEVGASGEQSIDRADERAGKTSGKSGQSGNKLWTIARHHNESSIAHTNDLRPGEIGHGTNEAAQNSFQLVWTGLSFKVALSSYDKLVNGVIEGARTVCGLGSVSRRLVERSRAGPADSANSPAQSHKESTLSIASSMSSTASTERRLIFKNLNGFAKSGEITAILGPSGSGKTSLLNAICGKTANYGGQIQLLGGRERQQMRLSLIPQKDFLIESLTVYENLLYSSKILNADENFDHEANIARVVKMLNLSSCFHSRTANISGGEYKRVSIAQELLRQPDILILDEPTSGLDSLNCKKLIQSLAQLIAASRTGHLRPIAIIMTIHQPDVDIFHMFDHVYCMARGGGVIFDGHPRDAMRTIETYSGLATPREDPTDADRTGSGNPQPTFGTNPANLLIEIASEDLFGQEPIDRLVRHQGKQFECALTSIMRNSDNAMAAPENQLKANLIGSSKSSAGKQLATNMSAYLTSGHKISLAPSLPLASSATSLASMLSSDMESGPVSGSASIRGQNAAKCLVRDKRLGSGQDQNSGRFWYHAGVLTRRTFVSTLRDPMMTLVSLLFHLSVPFGMWTVYTNRIGATSACPAIQRDMDIVSMSSNRTTDKILDLQEELTTAFQCSTMFFLTTYAFSMCCLTVASLAFPLNMHILLKEVRNGWYNLPAYVLAKSVANFPFEVVFPVVSLVMIYTMLGMPSSIFEWRLCAIALVMALISMISHTQGLIFGALCMDSVQTAIFLASAMSLPQCMLSGYTAHIKYMPSVLQKLSWLSQYRYSSDLINMIRFGFGICPCDSSTDEYLRTHKPDFKDIPSHLKPIFIYYLSNPYSASADVATENATNIHVDGTAAATTTLSPMNASEHVTTMASYLTNETVVGVALEQKRVPGIDYDLVLNETERTELVRRMESSEVDLFSQMADMMGRSFTFGRKINDCQSVRSQLLETADTPPDSYLLPMFAYMFALLIGLKIVLYLAVRFKIGARV